MTPSAKLSRGNVYPDMANPISRTSVRPGSERENIPLLAHSAPSSADTTPTRVAQEGLAAQAASELFNAVLLADLIEPANAPQAPAPAVANASTVVVPSHPTPIATVRQRKRKESTFILPVFTLDNARGALAVGVKAIGYGGFMTLAPGAVAALLPPSDLKPQYIAAAVQGGLAAFAAAAVAIPEVQRFTEDKFIITPNAEKRWTVLLSHLTANDPLKVAVLVGFRQKYKLAARQVGALACTVGSGYFIGGPVVHWSIVSGGMAAGLVGVSVFGEIAQRKIERDAAENHPAILDLSVLDPSAEVDLEARKAIAEVERLSKETSILPDLGSGVSILFAAAGGIVGCLIAARIIGDKGHGDHNTELDALQRHVKFAVPFIIGGVSQMFMLPAEHKNTAISNMKMRAALAGRATHPIAVLMDELATV